MAARPGLSICLHPLPHRGAKTHLLELLFSIWYWLTGAESDTPSDEMTMAKHDATRLAEIEEAKDAATDDLLLGR